MQPTRALQLANRRKEGEEDLEDCEPWIFHYIIAQHLSLLANNLSTWFPSFPQL